MNWFTNILMRFKKPDTTPERIEPVVDIDLPKPKRKRVNKSKEIKVVVK